jgi:tetratricopeptide (TPR) repeat protein
VVYLLKDDNELLDYQKFESLEACKIFIARQIERQQREFLTPIKEKNNIIKTLDKHNEQDSLKIDILKAEIKELRCKIQGGQHGYWNYGQGELLNLLSDEFLNNFKDVYLNKPEFMSYVLNHIQELYHQGFKVLRTIKLGDSLYSQSILKIISCYRYYFNYIEDNAYDSHLAPLIHPRAIKKTSYMYWLFTDLLKDSYKQLNNYEKFLNEVQVNNSLFGEVYEQKATIPYHREIALGRETLKMYVKNRPQQALRDYEDLWKNGSITTNTYYMYLIAIYEALGDYEKLFICFDKCLDIKNSPYSSENKIDFLIENQVEEVLKRAPHLEERNDVKAVLERLKRLQMETNRQDYSKV